MLTCMDAIGSDGHAHAGASAQLAWLVSWDGFMHAFNRDQVDADFAVMALCGHISRASSCKIGQAVQCGGCLVAFGQSLSGSVRWQG